MLNPEKAQEYLKSVELKDGSETRLKQIAGLPDSIRWIGYGLLNRKEDGTESTGTNWRDFRSKAEEALGALPQEQRRDMFTVLFPAIAHHVEAGWRLFERLPYQTGAGRRAFRAPGRADLSASPRIAWIASLLYVTNKYDQPVEWWAAWVPYIGWGGETMGYLFAAAIDAGGEDGDAVYDMLVASAKGEHDSGAMGRHVSRGLLMSSRPDGWDFMEKFLLAAQRQEGLRQVILETIDEAHPDAFRRMLHCILDNELLRFSATLRAVDVWFGFGYDVETLKPKESNTLIAQILQFIEEEEARDQALAQGAAQSAYLALCAAAYQDAVAAVDLAARMLRDESPERRFAAVHCLNELNLKEARDVAVFALEDSDLRVAWHAFNVVRSDNQNPELFQALEKFLLRLPKKDTELDPIVWPWMKQTTSVTAVGSALRIALGNRSPKRLIPYLPFLDSYNRSELAELLAKQKKMDDETRKTLFGLIGDPQDFVREKAIAALAKVEIAPDEAQALEKLLSRKAGSLRRGVLTMLLKQTDDSAIESAERLLNVTAAPMRQAGLEVLQQLIKEGRKPQECRAAAERYRTHCAKPDDTEAKLLEAILDETREIPTLDNGLGLFRPEDCSPAIPPRTAQEILSGRDRRNILQKVGDTIAGKIPGLTTDTPAACLKSLNKLITKHKETPVVIVGWDEQKREQLLGDLAWLPAPNPTITLEEDLPRLPLHELWETWWQGRSPSERDADGFELLRLAASMQSVRGHYYGQKVKSTWTEGVLAALFSPIGKEIERWTVVDSLIRWLLRMHFPAGAYDFLLDAVEITFSLIPPGEHTCKIEPNDWYDRGWRKNGQVIAWLNVLNQTRTLCASEWTEAHDRRLWQLLHWMDKPAEGAARHRPDFNVVMHAYKLGVATRADVMEQLIGPRVFERYATSQFPELKMLTGRKPHALLNEVPDLAGMVDQCRQRIIEIELHRGDMPTAASAPAVSLRSLEGVATLANLMSVYGAKEPFVRAGTNSQFTRKDVFSHLIRSTFPAPDETPQKFAQEMQTIKASPNRLVELAVFAPQWARNVQNALEWRELEEAVWWIHAHTKDQGWTVDAEIRAEWTAQSSQLTPLSPENLLEGAVDVAWFHRVYDALGPDRWAVLDSAAKYASGGGGHKRAQLFADAMLGRLTQAELAARITDKRNADALRAVGLLPVPDDHTRKEVLLQRYKIVQEFLRTSKQFGAQRQESEKKAAGIAMENLSRSAGYADPNRLQWAMEAEAVADLANGPITVTVEEVAVTLSINFLGKPDIEVLKTGKPLTTVPPPVKKDPAVAALFDRKKDIERQGSRMRLSLEQAMCRGDIFTTADLKELLAHPVLRPMLRSLVFIGQDDPALVGYPVDGGAALERHDGRCVTLADTARLRIAHAYELMETAEWHLWQKECFLRERIQPFKQVFRELYVLTDAEQKENKYSVRYEGHQVMPRQSMALAGARGWIHTYEEGVRRTFHAEGLTAWLTFDQFFSTPAEVEGLTVQQVYFTKRGEWKPLDLGAVPPRIFSEAMRDVDLIVSVAHAGGVDPEASASTVEMRESLLRETLGWLKIGNVRFQSAHALIDGKLGVYTVHMGSAVVHRQPGGHLCIVPVHGQHRGRLFLPFADDDPKTAEVISKVLLLSKDEEIKDPVILEQILPRAR